MPAKFTATEQRIMDLLADGKRHTRDELFSCLEDEMQKKDNVNVHLTYIRRKIRPVGHDIISISQQGTTYYQHVTLVSTDD